MGLIFTENWESGAGAWTITVTAPSSVSVVAAAAKFGAAGLRTVRSGTNPCRAVTTANLITLAPGGGVWASWWMRVNNLPVVGAAPGPATGLVTQTVNAAFITQHYPSGSAANYDVYAMGVQHAPATGLWPSVGEWFLVQMRIQRSALAVAPYTGEFELIVGGVQQLLLTGVNNYVYLADALKLRLGYYGGCQGESVDYDYVAVDNAGWPVSSPPAGVPLLVNHRRQMQWC